MWELVFVVLAGGAFLYFSSKMVRSSNFELGSDEVYFLYEKITIPYAKIISLERDISSGEGRTMYFGYIVTYETEKGLVDSFRIYQARDSMEKWQRFTSKLLEHNPFVKINDSIF